MELFIFYTLLIAPAIFKNAVAQDEISVEEESTVDGTYYTNIWAVKLSAGTDADKLAEKFGFLNEGVILEEDDGTFFEFKHPKVDKNSTEPHAGFELSSEVGVLEVIQQVLEEIESKAMLHHQNPSHRRSKRQTYNDPYWSQAWHLSPLPGNPTMMITSAWAEGITGNGVNVVHTDDGIDYTHPDLRKGFKRKLSMDMVNNDTDVFPVDWKKDTHGTSMAGLAVARANNSQCAVGIAHNANVGMVLLLNKRDPVITDAEYARAINFAINAGADVMVFGQGPSDSGGVARPIGPLRRKAHQKAVSRGRGRKGVLMVYPSGNGGRYKDSCAMDAAANDIHTMAINAVGERGTVPKYTENCTAVIASAFSSGVYPDRYMVTTKPGGECTDFFSGTSSSTAVAGGVMALLLEAKPDITWRDAQHLVIRSTRPRQELASGAEWRKNGANLYYSRSFGFGLIDAGALVRNALSWQGAPDQIRCEKSATGRNIRVAPQGTKEATVYLRTVDCKIRHLEHVLIEFTSEANKRGDMRLRLTSPMGTNSLILPTRKFDYSKTPLYDWQILTMEMWDENPIGEWKLQVDNIGEVDGILSKTLLVRSWKIIFYGTENGVGKFR